MKENLTERLSAQNAIKILRSSSVLDARKRNFEFDFAEEGLSQADLYRIAEANNISHSSIVQAYASFQFQQSEDFDDSELFRRSKDYVENAYERAILTALTDAEPDQRFVRGYDTENRYSLRVANGEFFNAHMWPGRFYHLELVGQRSKIFGGQPIWHPKRLAALDVNGAVSIQVYDRFFAKACEKTILQLKDQFPDYEQRIQQEF